MDVQSRKIWTLEEVSYIKNNYKSVPIEQMSISLSRSKDSIKGRLKKEGITKLVIRENILGKRQGYLFVKSISHKSPDSRTIYYNCECLYCNQNCIKPGCIFRGKGRKQITCGCKEQKSGKSNDKWKGYGEISGEIYYGIVRSGVDRDIEFSIDIKILWNLFLQQNRKCALSGQTLIFGNKSSNKSDTTASLDRIDSSRGYVIDNIQWIHKDINRMKQHFDEEYFIKTCKLIAEHKT